MSKNKNKSKNSSTLSNKKLFPEIFKLSQKQIQKYFIFLKQEQTQERIHLVRKQIQKCFNFFKNKSKKYSNLRKTNTLFQKKQTNIHNYFNLEKNPKGLIVLIKYNLQKQINFQKQKQLPDIFHLFSHKIQKYFNFFQEKHIQ